MVTCSAWEGGGNRYGRQTLEVKNQAQYKGKENVLQFKRVYSHLKSVLLLGEYNNAKEDWVSLLPPPPHAKLLMYMIREIHPWHPIYLKVPYITFLKLKKL